MGMVVLINPRAGKSGNTARRPETQIAALFAALGETPRIVQPQSGSELISLAREAARGNEQTIVAAGGDGTISTVAGELAGMEKTLGVLPMGTLNHFAKDLRIPLDLAAAVRAVVHGRVKAVDAGEVNGRIFINNSSLGIYPQIVSRRQMQQQRLGRSKWPAFFRATMHAFRRFPFLHLQIEIEGQQLARTTPFLFVGNNAANGPGRSRPPRLARAFRTAQPGEGFRGVHREGGTNRNTPAPFACRPGWRDRLDGNAVALSDAAGRVTSARA
jgi:diacylglycerol kinase family enzyme